MSKSTTHTLKGNDKIEVTADKVKKDTTIKSPTYGEIIITAGNYVLTDSEGNQVGITESDLNLHYDVKKSKK